MKNGSISCLLMSTLLAQFGLIGCGTNESYLDEAPVDPQPVENRYGADGGPLQGEGAPAQGGRFGFSGDDAAGGTNKREVRDMTKHERDAAGNLVDEAAAKKESMKKKAKSGGPPSLSEYKSANKVSGDPLAVTLPGVSTQISIEKLDSSGQPTGQPLPKGTPVAIPDPNNPGKKIYFKVP